jgi:ribonuclease HII
MDKVGPLLLGIDEAGRGPVIGPLVLGGVWIHPSRQAKLLEIGVQDSKLFGSSTAAQRRRADLARQIRRLSACTFLLVVDAAEVDRRTRLGELNLLEQELAAGLIAAGPPARRIIADGARLFGPLTSPFPRLRAVDHADATFPAVSAASILAKVERDARFVQIADELRGDLGPIRGGGYANSATAAFLRAYFARHSRLPAEVRRSWSWPVLQELDRLQAGARPVRRGEQLQLPTLADHRA